MSDVKKIVEEHMLSEATPMPKIDNGTAPNLLNLLNMLRQDNLGPVNWSGGFHSADLKRWDIAKLETEASKLKGADAGRKYSIDSEAYDFVAGEETDRKNLQKKYDLDYLNDFLEWAFESELIMGD